MILTVTPNAALDKTYRVEGFALDRVHRPSLALTVAGGKGINVARVYQTLGGEAVATGFLGGLNGRIVSRALEDEKILNAFVRTTGETRLCIAVIDPTSGTQTEVNESGPEISPRAVAALKRRVEQLIVERAPEYLVLSGSLPPGVPATIYADLIEVARRHGIRSVLDSSQDALRCGLQARPWMVKPNRYELEHVLGHEVEGRAGLIETALEILQSGVDVAAITSGAEGAVLATREAVLTSRPPSIPFASAVASGDSFVAAFLYAWSRSERAVRAEEALRLATGAGAANAAVIGAGFCTRAAILARAEEVTVKRVA